MALFHSQEVCDLVIRSLLTLSWPCPIFRQYVILLFGCQTACWPSHHLTTLAHSQFVCDLAIWMWNCLLTLSWPCSTFSKYMILLFGCQTACWPSHGLVLHPASNGLAISIPDCLLTFFFLHSAGNDLHISIPDCLLTLSWPCLVLRKYFVLLLSCTTACWNYRYFLFLFLAFRQYVLF